MHLRVSSVLIANLFVLTMMNFALLSCKTSSRELVSNPAMAGEGVYEAKETDALSTFTTCSIGCNHKPPQEFVVPGIYKPSDRGLKPGNGLMWGSLSSDLEQFATESCVAEGISQCGQLPQISDFAVSHLKSGTWSVEFPMQCETTKTVLSPFQDGSGAQIDLGSNLSNARRYERFVPMPLASQAPCSTWLNSKLCFGDCLTEQAKDQWIQTIGTSKPLGTSENKICADALLNYLNKAKVQSPSLQVAICRHFYVDEMRRNEKIKIYAACAAIRAEVDCQSILKRLN